MIYSAASLKDVAAKMDKQILLSLKRKVDEDLFDYFMRFLSKDILPTIFLDPQSYLPIYHPVRQFERLAFHFLTFYLYQMLNHLYF